MQYPPASPDLAAAVGAAHHRLNPLSNPRIHRGHNQRQVCDNAISGNAYIAPQMKNHRVKGYDDNSG